MLKVIKREGLSREEYALATFLQGGVNRAHGGTILIDVDDYLAYVTEPWEYAELYELADEYIGDFEGLAIYDLAPDDISINLAATVCAARSLLGVPRVLADKFRDKLPTLFDAARCTGSRAERQNEVFELCKDELNPAGIVHQVVEGADFHLELRDFAIERRYFTFFTDDECAEDLVLRDKVLRWAKRNIGIYGWTKNEIAFLKSVSAYGNYVVPMDWSANHSYFSARDSLVHRCKQAERTSAPAKESGKHYLAIVVSDGDNVQWLERDFSADSTFGQRMKSPFSYKMNWTISPSMASLCPSVLEKIYSYAKNDYFITGVSGIGYTNLLTYPAEHLPAYAEITADAMHRSDLKYICMLDNVNMLSDSEEVRHRLDILASHREIHGGIWELDPDRYQSGGGRVLFSSDGKPFLSVRLSLWHPSNRMGMITHAWLDEYAEKINSYPISPKTVDGYTVLNVHPWTVRMEDLDYLVGRLAPHVELVYVDELLEMLEKNVPHRDAVPKK